jgi:hypothetical protein
MLFSFEVQTPRFFSGRGLWYVKSRSKQPGDFFSHLVKGIKASKLGKIA